MSARPQFRIKNSKFKTGGLPMPLTAQQTTQIFEILGVPQDGSGDVFASVATLFGPAYETYDMAAIVSRINAKLAALTATQITRVTELLDRQTAITATSPLQNRSLLRR